MDAKPFLAAFVALALVAFLPSPTIADPVDDRQELAEYLSYTEEHDIPVEKREWSFFVPEGLALHLQVDLKTLEATASSVDPDAFFGLPAGGGGFDPNCLSMDYGRIGLAASSPLNGHGVPGLGTCEQEVHNIGTDFVELVVEGDGYSIINAGLDWTVGIGFVWLDCEAGHHYIGDYNAGNSYDCYLNVGGTPPEAWWEWDAALLDRNRDPDHLVWARMHFAS